MSFVPPTFNLHCDIYRDQAFGGPPTLSVKCNLAFGRRVQSYPEVIGGFLSQLQSMTLLVPAGTDIRDDSCRAIGDGVEVPPGSGRRYVVCFVDDIGKGFDNEHRAALLLKSRFALWPQPIP